MAQINVTINGVSRAATLTWDDRLITLVNSGGTFTTAFDSDPGIFIYAIVVFGSPDDPWSATVTDGTTTHNFAGHMSPGGNDTSGDTRFKVAA